MFKYDKRVAVIYRERPSPGSIKEGLDDLTEGIKRWRATLDIWLQIALNVCVCVWVCVYKCVCMFPSCDKHLGIVRTLLCWYKSNQQPSNTWYDEPAVHSEI